MTKTLAQVKAEQLEVQDRWFEEWNATGEKPNWNYDDVCSQIVAEWLNSLQVGDHAHVCRYTDIEPCTVIKRTACSITVRYDKAELNGTWKPEVVLGGFVGHCVNNHDQVYGGWDIEEDLDGMTETFRWSTKYQRWYNNAGEQLKPEWLKFYDYNF